MNNYEDIDDNMLSYLIEENDENVKNIVYEKYKYIIDIIIKKHSKVIQTFKIDEVELRQEASYGFSDGIKSYSSNYNTSLKTFLTLCIERRVNKLISRYTSDKANTFKKSLSLDVNIKNTDTPLRDMVKDNPKYDPLNDLTSVETIEEIIDFAKNYLSEEEYKVFGLMIDNKDYKYIANKLGKTPKQIDNTIQRIKLKFRKYLDINV